MPTVLLNGVNVNLSTITSTIYNPTAITLSDTTVEGLIDVYISITVLQQETNRAGGGYSNNHPTVFFSSQNLPLNNVVGGSVASLPAVTDPVYTSTNSVFSDRQAKTYVWKTTFTPSEDYVGSGSIVIPSNFLGYSWTLKRLTHVNPNRYSYTDYTEYVQSFSTSFSIDTEVSYDLTVSAPLSLESPPDNLDPDLISVDEGGTATFTLQTTHLSAGRTLAYRIDGAQQSDLGGVSLTGNVTVGADGRAILAIPIAEDETTEGLESLTLTILNIQGTDEVSQTIQIIDASLTPPPDLNIGLRNDSGRDLADLLTNEAVLEIQGLEVGTFWEYSLNGGVQWLLGQGTSLTVDGDGSQQVMVRQIDQNGTSSDISLIQFDIDTIAQRPALSLLSDSGSSVSDQYTNAGLILIDDLEVDSVWEYSQDGGNLWQFGAGSSLLINEDGYHQILIRQNDLAGNTSEISELTFTLDAGVLSPDLNLRSDTGISGDLLTNVGTIDLGSLELGSSWDYSFDGGLNWQDGQGTSLSVSRDGPKQVQVRQVDRAGNISEVNSLSFILDTQAYSSPTLNLFSDSGTQSGDRVTNSGLVMVSGIESGSTWQYSLNGGDNWSAGLGNSVGISGDGSKSLQVRQTDLAGNISTARTLSFTLDTVATTPSLSLRNDTGISASDRVTNSGVVNVSNLEVGSAWEYSLNGGLQWITGRNDSVSLSSDGLKQLQVRQTDLAGNLSAVNTINLTLDTSAPQIEPILNPQIEGQRTYFLSGVANPQNQVKIVIDEQSPVLVSADNLGDWRLNSLLSPEGFELTGLRQVAISQVDPAGNEGPAKRFYIVAERSPRPDPTYELRAASDSVNEGSSIRFNLSTTNIDPGTDLQYLIEGIDSGDVQNGQFYGLVRIGANGQAVIDVPIRADQQLEGAETITVKVANASASARVNDTSVPTPTPTPTPTINPISKVLDAVSESYGLYQLDTKQWVIGQANLPVDEGAGADIIVLKKGTKAFASSAENADLLFYADGTFGVVMSAANNTSWSEQKFTSEGLANGAPKKLSQAEILAYERFFEKDINNDNQVGEVVAESFNIATTNNLGLYRTDANSIVVDVAGLSIGAAVDEPVTLMVAKKSYLPAATPLALIAYDDSSMGIITQSGTNFTEQKFLSNGLASGKAIKLTTAQLLAKESALGIDLNGNGSIGDSVGFVFDDGLDENSDYGLYRTESGALVIDNSGLSVNDQTESPVMLMSGAKLFITKSTTASLVSYDDGFGLITGSGTKWTEQLFDTSGLISGKAQKLNLLQLLDKELIVSEDLDNDNLIGNVINEVGANSGNWQAYKTKTSTFVFEEVGLSIGDTITTEAIDLMSAPTRSWTVKAGSTIQGLAEIDDQYLELLVQSGTTYTAQKFDLDTGLIYGKALKLNDATLQAREFAYEMDLNNDNQISLTGQTSAPADWAF